MGTWIGMSASGVWPLGCHHCQERAAGPTVPQSLLYQDREMVAHGSSEEILGSVA